MLVALIALLAAITVAGAAVLSAEERDSGVTTAVQPQPREGFPPLVLSLGVRDDAEADELRRALRLYEEGRRGSPKMMSVGLHCRLIGRPGRVAGLRRFLDHARAHEGVWFARRIDIARHWAARHPPVRRHRPSRMTRADFVACFGGIFEHSPCIAEPAFHAEPGPAHDTATGLHSALARIFRSAPREERLRVLAAHPDLAGRLAQARRLTGSSASEQTAAGLDALGAAAMILEAISAAQQGAPLPHNGVRGA